MKRKTTILLFFLCCLFSFSQMVTDSVTRRPALRGHFRWIITKDMFEEGEIRNNIKVGPWEKYFRGSLSGKTMYEDGLAVQEYWNYKDSLKLRYTLSPDLDSMTVYYYDMDGKITNSIKYVVDKKTFFLNYSLMTEDTIFKKMPVTLVDYNYHPWKHRDDVIEVKEATGGIVNLKYFFIEDNKPNIKFELNDKGDLITGKKKDFNKEKEKEKKFIEEELKKNSPK